MKICGYLFCMPQDEEYVLYCIESLLSLDDIIITCPTKRMWRHRCNAMSILEQDRTIEYLELAKSRHPDKIHLIFADGWESPNEQWQAGFDKMAEIGMQDEDAFIIAMPDEVWAPEDLQVMIDLCHNEEYNYSPHKYDFFGNFEWMTRGGEGRNYRFEVGMSLDAVTSLCEFQYHRHPHLNQFLGKAALLREMPLYHFTWCHNMVHFRQKAEWNNVFYAGRKRDDPIKVLERWLAAKDKSTVNVKMNLDAEPIYTKRYDEVMPVIGNPDERTEPFKREFPDLLKRHPYYGLSVEEVLAYKGEYEI